MDTSVNTRVFFYSAILLLILLLSMIIFLTGKDYECGRCIVTLKQIEIAGKAMNPPKVMDINIYQFYDSLIEDKCFIRWDYNNGYYFTNE